MKGISSLLQLPLLREFLWRELRSRFAGSLSGGLWAVFQPLLQLAVYSFAFVYIFKARLQGQGAPDFVLFLFAALWLWTAFSEALLRSATVIQENASLIGKVALPRAVLVAASVGASFLVHMTGFVFVVLVLILLGKDVHLVGLLPTLLLFVPLFVLTLGMALALSAIQVFVRDLAQVLGQLLTLLMFAAPIFYERASMPAQFHDAMDLHPFTFYAEASRSLLLHYGSFDPMRLATALAVAFMALLIGYWIFRRLDPHFEDFL